MFMRYESAEEFNKAAVEAAYQQWHATHVCSLDTCGQNEVPQPGDMEEAKHIPASEWD